MEELSPWMCALNFTLQGSLLVRVGDFTGTEGSDQIKKLTSVKVCSSKSALLLKPEHIGGFNKSPALSCGLNLNSFFEEFLARSLLFPLCLCSRVQRHFCVLVTAHQPSFHSST